MSIRISKRKYIWKVNGMRVGDSVYYQDIRYIIKRFITRKEVRLEKVENVEGFSFVTTSIKNIEPIY